MTTQQGTPPTGAGAAALTEARARRERLYRDSATTGGRPPEDCFAPLRVTRYRAAPGGARRPRSGPKSLERLRLLSRIAAGGIAAGPPLPGKKKAPAKGAAAAPAPREG